MVESNQTETNFLQPQSLLKAFSPTKTLNLLNGQFFVSIC